MIVGTAGHIDHGKTSLVRALTGVETDRLKEEKQRGISIDLGFAYRSLEGGGRMGFVDVPGHERFVHTMLAGAGGIDFALLVVAADDGVMPQTREHLAILDLLGIEKGLVALTKTDLVPPERLEEVRAELHVLLGDTGLAGADILSVSTTTGEGVDALRARLDTEAARFHVRSSAGRFRLAVDRSFVLAGAGTVVTGTVLSGRVRVGDAVTVSPSGLSARVRSIHAQDRKAEEGVTGDRCALNLAGESIARDAVKRGDMVVDPALHAPTSRIDATLRVLASEPKPIGQWFPVRLHHGAEEIGARIVLLGEEPVAPGGQARVQLVLERPVAAASGDRFVIRDTSARRTAGGGRFIDLRAPARRRRTPERLAQLSAMAEPDHGHALARLLDTAPYHAEFSAFLRDRAAGEGEASALAEAQGFVTIAGDMVMAPAHWLRLTRALAADLEAFHAENPDLPGMGMERLRLQSEPRLPAPVFRAALQALARQGVLSLEGAWVRLAGHEARLSDKDEAIWTIVEPQLAGEERFRPPRTRDLAALFGIAEADMRRVLKTVSRMGRTYEVAQDHFFPRAVVAEIVAIMRDIAAAAPKGEFTAADLRDRLANGRKVAIQILEFFDRHGLTLRRGDLRRLNPHRLDLFGEPGHGREASPVGRPDFKSGRGHSVLY
ncbi:selenocysteine-specific translation elongation factor [Aureimonas populi]|uniref:selenocysteine-specific translation elongation factor n=1 Tax=Aureimonas populi TaxID=1701758 RepID=UPI001AE3F5D9|nr:selenocysteine-specific translation elongation factor [Aureimonas populi]